MKKIIEKHRLHWTDKSLISSTLVGIAMFILSMIASNAAVDFATDSAAANVPDLIISNIPVFNVDFIVNEVAMFFSIFILAIAFFEPRRIPFMLKSIALFIFIRSAFITLTHLGPFPAHSYIDQTALFSPLNLGSDFFFSGHTGLPYLMALIFWKNIFVRNISLIAAVLFGVSVLLGHLHYSIDVFAAFFITYSIFVIAKKFFAKDYEACT